MEEAISSPTDHTIIARPREEKYQYTPPPGLATYAYRWDTDAPTAAQLKRADSFFTKSPPKHLWSEAKFKKIDYGDAPEVCASPRGGVVCLHGGVGGLMLYRLRFWVAVTWGYVQFLCRQARGWWADGRDAQKSSILNALLRFKGMAYTSSKPGKTRLMSAFAINQGKMVLIDMPGYGHASREDWGLQIMKYLSSRKQ